MGRNFQKSAEREIRSTPCRPTNRNPLKFFGRRRKNTQEPPQRIPSNTNRATSRIPFRETCAGNRSRLPTEEHPNLCRESGDRFETAPGTAGRGREKDVPAPLQQRLRPPSQQGPGRRYGHSTTAPGSATGRDRAPDAPPRPRGQAVGKVRPIDIRSPLSPSSTCGPALISHPERRRKTVGIFNEPFAPVKAMISQEIRPIAES